MLLSPVSSKEKFNNQEEYYDFLSLCGLTERPTLGYQTLSDSKCEIETDILHLWDKHILESTKILWESPLSSHSFLQNGFYNGIRLKIFGPEWFNSYNTALPYGQNDGSLWQGKGYNTSFSAGINLKLFGIEATFKPQITWSQNKDFEYLPGVYGDSHSYFWAGNIDLVQRYGDSSLWQFDWGDSEIRYSFYNFTFGFGTQSPWLGPAVLNPMLGSNNAGTYPKFDFGLRKTNMIIPGLNWNLGKLESRIWVGQLTESDYFDNNGKKDKNLVNGFNLSFSPAFAESLTIGATKICISRWGDNFIKYLNPFYSDNNWENGATGEDQKASVYFDLLFDKIGFEIYSELGIDDYSSEPIANAFHTMIYTIGFKKAHTFNKKLSGELIFEWNNFEMSQDFQLQWGYMGYYSHGLIAEGYTQNGQIIGAGSGYMGNSQYLAYKLYYEDGVTKFYIHRNCPDTNFIYNKAIGNISTYGTEIASQYYAANRTFLTFGISNTYLGLSNISLTGEINYSLVFYNTYNRYLVGNYTHNFYFSNTIKYYF